MAGPCFEDIFGPKLQDSTNMGTLRQTPKRTAKRDIAENDQQGERGSRIQDIKGGGGGPILH